MKWHKAKTFRREETSIDELGISVRELVETGDEILVRAAPWKPIHDSTEGNEFDYVERTFLTRAKPELLEGIEAIQVGDLLYEVKSITHESNPVAIRVGWYKNGF